VRHGPSPRSGTGDEHQKDRLQISSAKRGMTSYWNDLLDDHSSATGERPLDVILGLQVAM
jgi:hypothetical protein